MEIKILRSFKRFSLPKLIEKVKKVCYSMNANSSKFPEPKPTDEEINNAIDKCDDAKNKVDLAQEGLKNAKLDLKDATNELKVLLNKRANYVDYLADGDIQLIIDSGFDPSASERHGTSDVKKVEHLESEFTGQSGQIKLTWDSIPNATSYQTYGKVINSEEQDSPWKSLGLSTKSTFTLKELESGKRMLIKVAAFNANGEGQASDYIDRIIP